MHFELEGIPVSVNQSLQASGNRLIHTPAARKYRAQTELALQSQLDQQTRVDPIHIYDIEQLEGEPLFCHIRLYASWVTQAGTIRKQDIDNKPKLLLDSLVSVMHSSGYDWFDDSAIYFLLVTKHNNEDEPDRTVLDIGPLKSFNLKM